MPYVNADGNVAHGVAGVGVFFNGFQVDTGGGTCFVNTDWLAYQHQAEDGVYIALAQISTGVKRRAVTDPAHPFYNKGANTIFAGGNVWAAWLSGFGVYASTGLFLPDAGLLGVGANGEIAYIENYQNGYPVRVREVDGTDWLLSADPILDVQLYGSSRALWIGYDYRVHVKHLPVPMIIDGLAARPRATVLDGAWWISYFTGNVGVVLHPFDSTVGYLLAGLTEDCWQDIAAQTHTVTIKAAWSVTQGEAPADMRYRYIDVSVEPRVDLTPSAPIPPDPEPPEPPEDTVKPPVVTVDKFTLDDVLDGREIAFHDDGNPELQIAGRVFVEGTNMRVTLSNKAGSATTGAQRTVHPCSQGTSPQPPEPEPPQPEPEPPTQFSLIDCFGRALCVGTDGFLTTGGAPATFEIVPIEKVGWGGLKANGKFCAAEGDNRIKADRDSIGEWEEWWITEFQSDEGNPLVSFSSWRALYLSSHEDGRVYADMENVGGWESFTKGEVMSGRPAITGRWTSRVGSPKFYDEHGAAVRYMGVSAFPLCRRYTDGVDITSWLRYFDGYNVLRVWDYVTWEGTGWESCSVDQWKAFLSFVRTMGWRVELTLLTDDDAGRHAHAEDLVNGLQECDNLLIEIGNEPDTHKDIDCEALRACCDRSGLLYTSGHYEDSKYWFGHYGTAHTPRDDNWSRKAHDLLEYFRGGGPSYPAEPACPVPWVADEPIRPDQAQSNWVPKNIDYRSYGGTAALLGGGALFHFDGGKYMHPPTAEDQQCCADLLLGLTTFPADAPGGPYSTLDEGGDSDDPNRGNRTYIVGNCMCRVRPLTPTCPQPGWTSHDPDGILFTRGY